MESLKNFSNNIHKDVLTDFSENLDFVHDTDLKSFLDNFVYVNNLCGLDIENNLSGDFTHVDSHILESSKDLIDNCKSETDVSTNKIYFIEVCYLHF